jgi:dTDP-glucose 4,6-dehydratase
MKVLVYGSRGWIGQQFISILSTQHIDFVIGNARLDHEMEVDEELDVVSPTHVASFIGRTHGRIGEQEYTTIDYLEQPGKLVENVRDNLFSPLQLAITCVRRGIHYTYLGTGCIFRFDEEHPLGEERNGFNEDSLPNFFGSSYSVVKGFTDRLMHLFKESILNLRIRMPITEKENPRNFITKITHYERICSMPNSMTVLPVLLPLVLDMMRRSITGTVNLTNPGLISHNEILEMYRELVNPFFTWKNFSVEEQRAVLAADRSNNFLETKRLQEMYPDVLPIREAVRQCMLAYRDSMKRTLLITGGCGFIGSNFINHFFPLKKFDQIINVDAIYYCAREENILPEIREDPGYVLIRGNLCDASLLDSIFKTHHITHVIHFAAQSHVQNSFSDSLKFTQDNVLGTHNLLEACRQYGSYLQKFIHVSTDEVYGESMNSIDEQHKTEHSILCPTNPYAATKAGAELIAQSYNHSYKMPIIITRGNNVYGRNQYPEKLIPRFVQLLMEDKKLTVQGDGSAIRGFLHATDTAKAFEAILERGKIGEIYNIGCDDAMEFSVMEIAMILVKLIKKSNNFHDWIEYVEDRPFNDKRYYISNKKLKELGWEIQMPFLEGLQDLISYMRAKI